MTLQRVFDEAVYDMAYSKWQGTNSSYYHGPMGEELCVRELRADIERTYLRCTRPVSRYLAMIRMAQEWELTFPYVDAYVALFRRLDHPFLRSLEFAIDLIQSGRLRLDVTEEQLARICTDAWLHQQEVEDNA